MYYFIFVLIYFVLNVTIIQIIQFYGHELWQFFIRYNVNHSRTVINNIYVNKYLWFGLAVVINLS